VGSRLVALVAVGVVVAGCSGAAVATPTVVPTPTAAPTASPTAPPTPSPSPSPSPAPFAGQPYTITIPPGWHTFNLADPAEKRALDAFVASNPSMGPAIALFETIPGVQLAANPLLGDELLVFTSPTNGVTLDTIAPSVEAQFKLIPGLKSPPKATKLTLPAGPAYHWLIQITANKPGGGTITVEESVYLLANDSTAVFVEFVTPAGGLVPDEKAIIDSLAFR
jgi:hypothetical protein